MKERSSKLTRVEAMALGLRFRRYRKIAGHTLATLKKATGLHVNTIRQHEGGFCLLRADALIATAHEFEIDAAELIRLEESDIEAALETRAA